MQKEYRCTRIALYTHKCTGRDDIRERQGYYVWAASADLAWEKMATKFPEEVGNGFTVHPWENFDVKVVFVKRHQ